MNKSESIAALAEALAKAQVEIKAPFKNKTVKVSSARGSYSFSYATLDSVMDAVREPLANNGLSYSQGVESGNGKLYLVTVLMHSSGEWIESHTPMDVQQPGMQAMGSAISYARRYGLSNILGITADEDDDGNGSDGNKVSVVREAPSREEILKLKAVVTKDPKAFEIVDKYTREYNVKSPADLSREQFDNLVCLIQTLVSEK